MSQEVHSSEASGENNFERIQSMFRSVEEEFEKLQKAVEDRRKDFGSSAQKRVDRIRDEFTKTPLYKRAESLRKDAAERVEKNVDAVLSALNIATRSDIEKLDRKLSKIRKQLKELEKHETADTPTVQ